MRYRPFGRSGLALSTIGLHLSAHVLTKNRGLSEKLITAALENGINTYHFDSADPKTLRAAADIFAVVERRLLFISITACDTAVDGMSYELTPLKDRLRGAIKDSGLQWLDLVLFDKAGTTTLPDNSYDFVKTLQRSKMLRYIGARAQTADMADLIHSRRFDVIRTGFDIDSTWDKRRQIDTAIANEMAIFAEDTFPDNYRKASDLIPREAKRGWFGAKAKNPLAGAGTYAFLHQTPDWTPEELCLGYALSQPSLSCIYVEADNAAHLESLAHVPERHLPSSVPAQIEMARFTGHPPKAAGR
jgi:aryl-alcohol dehydrogenase-like predicted oxidoreductase